MKNFYILLFLILSFTGYSQIYNNGNLSVINQTPNQQRDRNNCATFVSAFSMVEKTNSFQGDSVIVYDSNNGALLGVYVNQSGTSPFSFPLNNTFYSTQIVDSALVYDSICSCFLSWAYNNYISPYKVISGIDTVRVDWSAPIYIQVYDPCEYTVISGNLFEDINMDCHRDSNEHNLLNTEGLNLSLSYSTGGDIVQKVSSNWDGTYSVKIQKTWLENGKLTVNPMISMAYISGVCTDSLVFDSIPPAQNDFGFTCTNNNDVLTEILDFSVSPGRKTALNIRVANAGCDPVSGLFKLVLDHRTHYVPTGSFILPDSISGDTLFWHYTNLKNYSAPYPYWNMMQCRVVIETDTTVQLNDTLCFTLNAPPLPGDPDTVNNIYHACRKAVASFDPNYVKVTPQGLGAEGYIETSVTTLDYAIHFQNTGSAVAYNISVVDTLDSNLIAHTLHILGASHNCEPVWLAPNIIKFIFKNIMLPDSSSNLMGSQGIVSFKIGLKNSMPQGTEIKNRAAIYFDYNAPVITNTVVNTLYSPLSIENIGSLKEMNIYPNPADINFTVINSSGSNSYYALYNLLGDKIKSGTLLPGSNYVYTGDISAGVYVLQYADKNEMMRDCIVIRH